MSIIFICDIIIIENKHGNLEGIQGVFYESLEFVELFSRVNINESKFILL